MCDLILCFCCSVQQANVDPETTIATDDNISESTRPVEPAEEKLSAKELALQAMGPHATSVRSAMAKNQSQENLIRTLSLIREEDDAEDNTHVKFSNGNETESPLKQHPQAIPRVVVSAVRNRAFFASYIIIIMFFCAILFVALQL